jgi:hypothetical protein
VRARAKSQPRDRCCTCDVRDHTGQALFTIVLHGTPKDKNKSKRGYVDASCVVAMLSTALSVTSTRPEAFVSCVASSVVRSAFSAWPCGVNHMPAGPK